MKTEKTLPFTPQIEFQLDTRHMNELPSTRNLLIIYDKGKLLQLW